MGGGGEGSTRVVSFQVLLCVEISLLMVNIPVGIAVTVTTRSNKAKVVLIPIRALTSELLELG